MSALRQPGPQVVRASHQTSNTISTNNLSLLPNDSPLARYVHEQPSISSHLSLGNSGYQTLKPQFLHDIDTIHIERCNCCQAEGAGDMMREIDDIVRMNQARGSRI